MHELSFVAKLTGLSEIPPVFTDAFGCTRFAVNRNETALSYILKVNDFNNLIFAHIHQGGLEENGPVVAFLLNTVSPTISVKEGTVQGTLTAESLVGPLEGQPLSALLELMRTGQAYVNVHSQQNLSGEIRGQIRTCSMEKR
ncbi:CHRD domain-containing protein [Bacillus carboniphilus]|uniref:CHRD domain-containing protein n=1 Tax=Bacillus carboniphilus TaxID=86663 RepID=A0ABY9JX55_9BACI|nr:CHRD domain-containing protein [Bacillus carboniphilus]WLR43005.1 CHRD domain-containing protein [Bacillus carboniphilus]